MGCSNLSEYPNVCGGIAGVIVVFCVTFANSAIFPGNIYKTVYGLGVVAIDVSGLAVQGVEYLPPGVA